VRAYRFTIQFAPPRLDPRQRERGPGTPLALMAEVFARSKPGAVRALREALPANVPLRQNGRPVASVEILIRRPHITTAHITESRAATAQEIQLHGPFVK
jgi:hypothetical protein